MSSLFFVVVQHEKHNEKGAHKGTYLVVGAFFHALQSSSHIGTSIISSPSFSSFLSSSGDSKPYNPKLWSH